jgi:hypothetical protein
MKKKRSIVFAALATTAIIASLVSGGVWYVMENSFTDKVVVKKRILSPSRDREARLIRFTSADPGFEQWIITVSKPAAQPSAFENVAAFFPVEAYDAPIPHSDIDILWRAEVLVVRSGASVAPSVGSPWTSPSSQVDREVLIEYKKGPNQPPEPMPLKRHGSS